MKPMHWKETMRKNWLRPRTRSQQWLTHTLIYIHYNWKCIECSCRRCRNYYIGSCSVSVGHVYRKYAPAAPSSRRTRRLFALASHPRRCDRIISRFGIPIFTDKLKIEKEKRLRGSEAKIYGNSHNWYFSRNITLHGDEQTRQSGENGRRERPATQGTKHAAKLVRFKSNDLCTHSVCNVCSQLPADSRGLAGAMRTHQMKIVYLRSCFIFVYGAD